MSDEKGAEFTIEKTSAFGSKRFEINDDVILAAIPTTHEVTPDDVARAVLHSRSADQRLSMHVARCMIRFHRQGLVTSWMRDAPRFAPEGQKTAIMPRERVARRLEKGG